jgi:hypothetical protein
VLAKAFKLGVSARGKELPVGVPVHVLLLANRIAGRREREQSMFEVLN